MVNEEGFGGAPGDGFSGLPPEFLQMLAIMLQGTAEAAGAPRTNTIRNLLQFQALGQKRQAAQQKAALSDKLSMMLSGGLRPGQQGPPEPYDPNAAAALGMRLGPDYAAQAVHPNLIAQKRLSGAMPSQASVDKDYAGGIGSPPSGKIGAVSFKPGAPEVSWRSPTSTGEHLALGVSESGATGAGRIAAAKQADVKLPDVHQLTEEINAIQADRTKMAETRYAKPDIMIELFKNAMASKKGKEGNKAREALDDFLKKTADPGKEVSLMVRDFVQAQRAQSKENILSSKPYENRDRITIAPEYEVFKAEADKSADRHIEAWRDAHNGEDPTVDDLRLLFIADLLEKSGASKWITPTPQP